MIVPMSPLARVANASPRSLVVNLSATPTEPVPLKSFRSVGLPDIAKVIVPGVKKS